jgi:hypothetical protein
VLYIVVDRAGWRWLLQSPDSAMEKWGLLSGWFRVSDIEAVQPSCGLVCCLFSTWTWVRGVSLAARDKAGRECLMLHLATVV